MVERPVLTFLTDVNVPDSVGDALMNAGHDVVRLREIMAIDAPDPIVATAAIEAKRILVTWDRDFHQQRFKKPRFSQLSWIGFSCPEPEGAVRLRALLDLIEFAIARAGSAPVEIRVGRDKLFVRC